MRDRMSGLDLSEIETVLWNSLTFQAGDLEHLQILRDEGAITTARQRRLARPVKDQQRQVLKAVADIWKTRDPGSSG